VFVADALDEEPRTLLSTKQEAISPICSGDLGRVYQDVYQYDAEARQGKLSPLDHQQHSGPVMEQLRPWLEARLTLKEVRTRAQARRAASQKCGVLSHSCMAPKVGGLFMSLIHTCELAGANPSDYLT
jgi:hypothetical protein